MLRITYSQGDTPAQRWSFGEERTETRIGRDPERCDVALPADEIQVSREHCALHLVLGRYRLMLNQENPVFVDGKPGFEGQILPQTCVLRLGKKGPRLLVCTEAAYDLPSTLIVDKTAQERPEETIERVVAPVRRERKWVLAGMGIVAALSVLGIYRWARAEERLSALVETQPSAEEQQRIQELISPRRHPKGFDAVLAGIDASVYLVLVQKTGTASPIGTAWVVDRKHGLLATCAHVPRGVPAGSLLLRRSVQPPRDLHVRRMTLHPGFDRFMSLMREHSVAESVSPGRDTKTLVPACDVALLEVEAEDHAAIGPDLPLAPESRLATLRPGTPLASYGFPLEGVSANYDRPQGRAQLGHLLALSDFFIGNATIGDARLLHVNLAVAGGSSGSPVIDADGAVIGIMSAGSFFFLRNEREGRVERIPTGVVMYAQRIDLLLELLADSAATAQAEREPLWAKEMQHMRTEGEKEVVARLVDQCARLLQPNRGSPTSKHIVARREDRIRHDATRHERTFDLKVPGPGCYVVVAAAPKEHDLDMLARFGPGNELVDASIGSRSYVLFPEVKDELLHICVYTKVKPSEDIPFELTVARLAY